MSVAIWLLYQFVHLHSGAVRSGIKKAVLSKTGPAPYDRGQARRKLIFRDEGGQSAVSVEDVSCMWSTLTSRTVTKPCHSHSRMKLLSGWLCFLRLSLPSRSLREHSKWRICRLLRLSHNGGKSREQEKPAKARDVIDANDMLWLPGASDTSSTTYKKLSAMLQLRRIPRAARFRERSGLALSNYSPSLRRIRPRPDFKLILPGIGFLSANIAPIMKQLRVASPLSCERCTSQTAGTCLLANITRQHSTRGLSGHGRRQTCHFYHI